MNTIVILCDTLRRDHCGPYTGGRKLNACWADGAPDWAVPTPNMDRLAVRGTVFNNAWCGSTPCMPARRDIYTGRFEFLERGWGPLEDDDLDLPRQVSGPPNHSIRWSLDNGFRVSELITDHFHLWEQGSGNYHMGYTGFEFIRGIEADAWKTDPVDFPIPRGSEMSKNERHYRNAHLSRNDESDWTAAKVFTQACDWLDRNHTHDDFYLHLDCFPPHEPLDPPEHLLEMFWPEGYRDPRDNPINWPYADWRESGWTQRQVAFAQARYAANVVLVDRWLGRLLDKLDELSIWDDTLVIFTTDHGTYNGDHGRLGKLQTHQHDACGHIPFIMCHPTHGHGETRDQLVQLVDIYPTVLYAVDRSEADGVTSRPVEKPLHGVNLLPVLENASAPTRDYAIAGQFGKSITITDGDWILHQSPADPSAAGNQPLYWHGHHLAKFLHYELGEYVDGRRPVTACPAWHQPTWLSDKRTDVNELENVADREPAQAARLQGAMAETLMKLRAPQWQVERLGLPHPV